MPISHLLLFPLLRLTDPYLRGEMDNTPLTGRGREDCMEELAFGWHGSQPGGSIPLPVFEYPPKRRPLQSLITRPPMKEESCHGTEGKH